MSSCEDANRRLYSHNFTTLYKQLSSNSVKWDMIGSHLGFQQSELQNIQARPLLQSGAPDSWLREMLSEWLEWGGPRDGRGSKGYATLHDLINALVKCGLRETAHSLLETAFTSSNPTNLKHDN